MGTAAVGDRELRRRAIEEIGASLVVAVDAREGVVATHGWREASGIDVLELAGELADDGVASVLYTDVARDGMDLGAALEETAAVARIVPTIASGGIRGTVDVTALAKISGVAGVIVGTALYEGKRYAGRAYRRLGVVAVLLQLQDRGLRVALVVLHGLYGAPGKLGYGLIRGLFHEVWGGFRDSSSHGLYGGVEGGVDLVCPRRLVFDLQLARLFIVYCELQRVLFGAALVIADSAGRACEVRHMDILPSFTTHAALKYPSERIEVDLYGLS